MSLIRRMVLPSLVALCVANPAFSDDAEYDEEEEYEDEYVDTGASGSDSDEEEEEEEDEDEAEEADEEEEDEADKGESDDSVPVVNDLFYAGADKFTGNLTFTTFLFRESAAPALPLTGGIIPVDTASPNMRLFGDLRSQMGKRTEKGWEYWLDARLRFGTTGQQISASGDNEYDLRQAFATWRGEKLSMSFGRMFIEESMQLDIDGFRADYKLSDYTLGVFAGAFPKRSSRSINEDYPGKIPVAFGATSSFEFSKGWGSASLFGIAPRAVLAPPTVAAVRKEKTRVALSSSLYYRVSADLDAYNFMLIDVAGEAGFGLTNANLGINYKPHRAMRLTAGYDRIDTETLSIHAQQQFEQSDPATAGTIIQNNIGVYRIASQAGRVGVSAALSEQRFEISTNARYRERPSVLVTSPDGTVTQSIPGANTFEFTFSAVDRRFWGGFRVGASYTRSVGVGAPKVATPVVGLAALTIEKELMDSRLMLDNRLWWLSSTDQNTNECVADPLATCFGLARNQTFGGSSLMYFRLKNNMFIIASGSLARQTMEIVDVNQVVALPAITQVTFLGRVAYRF